MPCPRISAKFLDIGTVEVVPLQPNFNIQTAHEAIKNYEVHYKP